MMLVKIFFWMSVLGVIIKCVSLAGATYPRVLQFSRTEDVVGLVVNCALLVWCWRVAWP